MSKKVSVALVSLILLAGCAQAPKLHVDAETAEPSAGAEEKAAAPNLSAEDDLMFLLLASEIAGQQGEYEVALDGYLAAAAKTGDPKVAERAAQIALYLKDDEKIRRAASLWIEKDQDNLSARKIGAVVFLKQGDVEGAKPHLDFLLDADIGEFRSALFEAVKIFSTEERKESVHQVFDRLEQIYPQQPEVPYIYALLAIQQNDFNRALNKVSKALALAPDMSDAVGLYAQIVSQAGDPEEGKRILQRAVAKNPGNMQLHMMYAQALIRLGDYQQAVKEFKRMIAKNPDYDDARFALALVQLQLKQDDAAYRNLEKLFRTQRWRNQAALHLGRIEARRNHIQNALDWLDQVSSGSELLEARVNAVSLLIDSKRFDEADGRLQELYDRFSDQTLRLSLLEAELLNARKRYEDSFELLSGVIEEMPDQPELLYARALVAERLGRLDVLEEDLKAILNSRPDDVNALNALGYALADRTDRYQEAQRYLDRAIELSPDAPAIMDSYGWLQYRLGNYELAAQYLRGAYKKVADPEIASHLIEVLWVMGRRDEAKALWREAIKRDREDEHLKEIRQRFKEAFDS